MPHYTVTVEIARPVAELFAYLTRPKNLVQLAPAGAEFGARRCAGGAGARRTHRLDGAALGGEPKDHSGGDRFQARSARRRRAEARAVRPMGSRIAVRGGAGGDADRGENRLRAAGRVARLPGHRRRHPQGDRQARWSTARRSCARSSGMIANPPGTEYLIPGLDGPAKRIRVGMLQLNEIAALHVDGDGVALGFEDDRGVERDRCFEDRRQAVKPAERHHGAPFAIGETFAQLRSVARRTGPAEVLAESAPSRSAAPPAAPRRRSRAAL